MTCELSIVAALILGAGPETKLDLAAIQAQETVTFRLTYQFSLDAVPPGAKRIRVWVPLPREDAVQTSELVELAAPGPVRFTRDREYGNPMAFFELPHAAGPLAWRFVHRIARRQVDRPAPNAAAGATLERYRAGDRLVPTTGFITEIAKDLGTGAGAVTGRARALYEYCRREMSYRKDGVGWGRGDVRWACDAKYGNCSDFHSLFIALCRVRGIPAKFEMGFPLPYSGQRGTIGGYHCWARFHDPEAGWGAVDISEAHKHPELADYFFGRLHARRVHFTTGRDITLEPPQAGAPLNFFIYPYVEIDDKPHAPLEQAFSFEILPADVN